MTDKHFNLKNIELLGTVLESSRSEHKDMKRQGRYRVHIPTLMPHITNSQTGIWVKNHAHKYRITNSQYGEYGQYFPIQPDTKVIVKFFEDDPNTGYIDRIISDYSPNTDVLAQDCVETKTTLDDRDEQYVLLKTPKMWNIIYINEETEKEPNTIYVIYNRDKNSKRTEREADVNRERRTVYRIDDSGIHIWTHDNQRVRIRLDDNKQVDGDQTEYVKGYRTKHIDKDDDLHVHKDQRLNIDNNRDKWVKGQHTTNIDKDEYEHVGGESRTLIDKDRHEIIHQNRKTLIDQNEDIHIGQNQKTNIDQNRDETVGQNKTVNIGQNKDEKIGGNLTIEVSGNVNLSASGNVEVKSNAMININGGPLINLNCSPPALYKPANSAQSAEDAEYPDSQPKPKYEPPYIETRQTDEASDEEDGNHRYDREWTNDGLLHADISKARTRVRDLGPKETKEYEMENEYSGNDKDKAERKQVVGKKCDDATDNYNQDHRETLTGDTYYEGAGE